MCDYGTRYPEAVPLKNIDAEHVAVELVKMFSRVGIPSEILTDQGANFMSKLLAEVYRLLSVKAITTSPYHPQTNGLVERFNQTLKAMSGRWQIMRARTGTSCYPTTCSPTERYHRHQRDFCLLSCCTVDQ